MWVGIANSTTFDADSFNIYGDNITAVVFVDQNLVNIIITLMNYAETQGATKQQLTDIRDTLYKYHVYQSDDFRWVFTIIQKELSIKTKI